MSITAVMAQVFFTDEPLSTMPAGIATLHRHIIPHRAQHDDDGTLIHISRSQTRSLKRLSSCEISGSSRGRCGLVFLPVTLPASMRIASPAREVCAAEVRFETGTIFPTRQVRSTREPNGTANAIENGMAYASIVPMTATLTLDKAGRLVLPKPVRDQLHLRAGSKLRLEVMGDHMELTQEVPEVKIVQRKDGLPVVVGWKGFDAAKAVREMREDQVARLDAPFRKK